ncbi:MAG: hypothetical protein SNF33_00280 (plasmid) [Candidatus Algichlamydia australiensis]|nr:hypothetical protein [Chlamydiales bacterium]
MNSLKEFLKENNFFARSFSIIAMYVVFRTFTFIGKSCLGEEMDTELKYFSIAGVLLGAYIAHQLYYRWIFPEKAKPTKS